MDALSLGDMADWTMLFPDDIFHLWDANEPNASLLQDSGDEFDPWFLFPDDPGSHEVNGSTNSSLPQRDEIIFPEVFKKVENLDVATPDDIVLTPISSSEAFEEIQEIVHPSSTSPTKDLPSSPNHFENEKHYLQSKKRKWEESLIIFSSNPKGVTKVRKRNSFNDARRSEVALIRLVGACVQCKLSKGRVSHSFSMTPLR
jgi:hypothetical protein